jgi:hypothetical protein
MTRKTKERARLMKLFMATGDDDYRLAAECLKVGLLEHLEALPRRSGRPKKKENSIDWPRLARIHRLVTAGASVLAAAQQEVDEHGDSHSKDATVTSLRKEYTRRRADVAAIVAMMDKAIADIEWFAKLVENSPRKRPNINPMT